MENINKIPDEKLQYLTIDELYGIYDNDSDELFNFDIEEVQKFPVKNKRNEYFYVDKENSIFKEGASWIIYYVYNGSRKNGDEQRELGFFNDDDFEKANLIAYIIANRESKRMGNGGEVKSTGTFKPLGSAKELGITPKIEGHDMIAICDCGEKFSYQNSKKNILWQCPECNGMKRIKTS